MHVEAIGRRAQVHRASPRMVRPVVRSSYPPDVKASSPIRDTCLIDLNLIVIAGGANLVEDRHQRVGDLLMNEYSMRENLLLVTHNERRMDMDQVRILPALRLEVPIERVLLCGSILRPFHAISSFTEI